MKTPYVTKNSGKVFPPSGEETSGPDDWIRCMCLISGMSVVTIIIGGSVTRGKRTGCEIIIQICFL